MKSPRDQAESPAAGEEQTKRVRITLSAYRLVEYKEIIEVPAGMSDEQLDRLVNERYEAVGADEFDVVNAYWERSDCTWAAAPLAKPELRLVPEPDSPGDFRLEEVEADHAASWPQEPA